MGTIQLMSEKYRFSLHLFNVIKNFCHFGIYISPLCILFPWTLEVERVDNSNFGSRIFYQKRQLYTAICGYVLTEQTNLPKPTNSKYF